VAAGADAKAASNVLMNELVAARVDPSAVDAAELAKLIEARGRIPRGAFLEALAASGEPSFSAERYLGETAITDASALEPLVDEVIAAHPEQVATYRSGKQGLLGFFVGQVMKATGGKADPRVVNELLRSRLQP
jgi:aspartyl-tRNA(Asn)/glutamyl-tRNA(Gln) amidotransferase subunit B